MTYAVHASKDMNHCVKLDPTVDGTLMQLHQGRQRHILVPAKVSAMVEP